MGSCGGGRGVLGCPPGSKVCPMPPPPPKQRVSHGSLPRLWGVTCAGCPTLGVLHTWMWWVWGPTRMAYVWGVIHVNGMCLGCYMCGWHVFEVLHACLLHDWGIMCLGTACSGCHKPGSGTFGVSCAKTLHVWGVTCLDIACSGCHVLRRCMFGVSQAWLWHIWGITC